MSIYIGMHINPSITSLLKTVQKYDLLAYTVVIKNDNEVMVDEGLGYFYRFNPETAGVTLLDVGTLTAKYLWVNEAPCERVSLGYVRTVLTEKNMFRNGTIPEYIG